VTILTAALAVGVGIHLALTLFLLLRYLESRDSQIGWWAAAYACFAAQTVADTVLTLIPATPLIGVRHVLLLAASWAMLQSFRSDARVTTVAILAAAASAILVPKSWLAGAVTASTLAAGGFVASAWRLYRQYDGLSTGSTQLLFGGLLLTAVQSLAYPLLRARGAWVGVEAVSSVAFSLLLSIGIVLLALQRSRDLITMSSIADVLNRSLDVRGALSRALDQVVELMRLSSGWVFLQQDDTFAVAATKSLPPELAAGQMVAMQGDCRCLQMLRGGQLVQAVNIVNCQRLEKVGWRHPRHVTVPLRTADRVVGVMNLVLPRSRALIGRDLATLSAIGAQIGLAAERARLYEEVRAKELLRGDLLQKVITAHEDERRRIARELHDEAGQAITALILNLEVAERAATVPEDKQRLLRLRTIAEDTLAELRRLIYDLRPTILDDLGLAAALRWYTKEHVEPQGLHVDLTLTGLEHRLPHHLETAAFRIVQEAFTNIIKHAEATQVSVVVSVIDRHVRLTVQDNGKGFDPGRVARGRGRGGMGLMGMQERAELIGGTWSVSSQPMAGTRVEAVIPVEAAHDEN
jgi:signal transduction histidine kinase